MVDGREREDPFYVVQIPTEDVVARSRMVIGYFPVSMDESGCLRKTVDVVPLPENENSERLHRAAPLPVHRRSF